MEFTRKAALLVLVFALGACSQTTPILQVLDPAPAPVSDVSAGPQTRPDAQTTGEVAVQTTGDRIFLVPEQDALAGSQPAETN